MTTEGSTTLGLGRCSKSLFVVLLVVLQNIFLECSRKHYSQTLFHIPQDSVTFKILSYIFVLMLISKRKKSSQYTQYLFSYILLPKTRLSLKKRACDSIKGTLVNYSIGSIGVAHWGVSKCCWGTWF